MVNFDDFEMYCDKLDEVVNAVLQDPDFDCGGALTILATLAFSLALKTKGILEEHAAPESVEYYLEVMKNGLLIQESKPRLH